MSYQAVQWALDEAPMLLTKSGKPDTTARAVLVARAERADEHGQDTHAGIAELIWRTGYDERTIQRAEDRLEVAGLMVRDGTTRHGTTRWNLDMSRKRDQAERDAVEAAVVRRKADNAARERARREQRKAGRVDAESARADAESTRVEFPSTRVDAAPPEPPMNHPGTIQEPSSGGTLPPDPLRPQSPSAPGTGIESSLSDCGDQPPLAPTVTYDRARENPPPGCPHGCTKGFLLIDDRFERCACLDSNVIPFPTDRAKESA